MTDPAPCRSLAELEKLVSQPLPREQVEELARHLEGCERCAEAVDRFLARDAIAGAARAVIEEPTISLAALADLTRRLHDLWPEFPGIPDMVPTVAAELDRTSPAR